MSAPAGWYPDPQSGGAVRWWDGAQWTVHAPQATAPVASGGWVAPAPVRVDTNTVWIWLAIVASVLPLGGLFFIDWNGYMNTIMLPSATHNSGAFVSGIVQWQVRMLLISGVSWLWMGVFILFSWLDWRELRRRGVPLPFSWAWSFFALLGGGAAVYVIGRTVVLKRRTESGGWAPLWVWIGATVLSCVIVTVWMVSAFEAMMAHMMSIYS